MNNVIDAMHLALQQKADGDSAQAFILDMDMNDCYMSVNAATLDQQTRWAMDYWDGHFKSISEALPIVPDELLTTRDLTSWHRLFAKTMVGSISEYGLPHARLSVKPITAFASGG